MTFSQPSTINYVVSDFWRRDPPYASQRILGKGIKWFSLLFVFLCESAYINSNPGAKKFVLLRLSYWFNKRLIYEISKNKLIVSICINLGINTTKLISQLHKKRQSLLLTFYKHSRGKKSESSYQLICQRKRSTDRQFITILNEIYTTPFKCENAEFGVILLEQNDNKKHLFSNKRIFTNANDKMLVDKYKWCKKSAFV